MKVGSVKVGSANVRRRGERVHRRLRGPLARTAVALTMLVVAPLLVIVRADAAPVSVDASLGMRPSGGFLDEGRLAEAESLLGRPLSWTVAMAGRRSPADMRSSVWGQMLSPTAVLPTIAHRSNVVMTVPLTFVRANAKTAAGQATIRAALLETAAGRWDEDFVVVAQSLVAGGFPDALIRLGHEMTCPCQPWSTLGNADAYIAAFRHVHDVMLNAAPRLRFEWNAARSSFLTRGAESYPGDAYVDVIGLDVYYEPWQGDPVPLDTAMWDKWYQRILEAHRDFAIAHGKPVSYAEWANGDVDEPNFIQWMYDWFASLPKAGGGRLLYQAYFNSGRAMFDLDNYPRSKERYYRLFGVANPPIAPAGSTTTPPAPPTSRPAPITVVAEPTNPPYTPQRGGAGSGTSWVVADTSFSHSATTVTQVPASAPVGFAAGQSLAAANYSLSIGVQANSLPKPADLQICLLQGARERACTRRVALPTSSSPVDLGPTARWWTSSGWDWTTPPSGVRILLKDRTTGRMFNTTRCGSVCYLGALPSGVLLRATARLVATPTA